MRDTRPDEAHHRLGEREGLRLEILLAAVQTYRQSVADPAMGHARRDLDLDVAREELDDVLRAAHVIYSSGETMRVRARVRRLEVDCEAELIRVSPTHVRCIFARAKRLDSRSSRTRRAQKEGGEMWRVQDESGARIGVLHATEDGAVRWRTMARHGEPAPAWGEIPGDLLARTGERFRAAMRAWLRRHGVET